MAAAAGCPASEADLTAAIDSAEAAWAGLDPMAFGVALGEARAAMGCLDGVLGSGQAARYHRLEGLNGFLFRDDRRAVDSFRAAVTADPGWDFSESLAPAGHPVRDLFDEARRTPPSPTTAMPLPACGDLYVDGVRVEARALDRPAILQVSHVETGALAWSGYLYRGDPTPDWPALPPVAAMTCEAGRQADRAGTSSQRRVVTWALYGTAGAAALTSGGLLVGALVERKTFEAREYSTPFEGEEFRERANGLYYAAQYTAGAAAALGGAGLTLHLTW